MADRFLDLDETFFRGQKSDTDPGQVPIGYFFEAMNMMNVGGVLSCRPGMRCLVQLPHGKLQGATIFRPKLGLEQFVVAVDGRIYVAVYPFKDFRLITNLQFSPHAKQMFWAHTEQGARRITTDFDSAIELIDPKNVLFIQDGGTTAPGWYDGSNSGHLRDFEFETPTGGAMAWSGERLWVAQGSLVFASDYLNPFSFREQIYLVGASAFSFPGDVTAMSPTPQSLDIPQLLVFTEQTCHILQSNIRDRSLWNSTVDFSREIFKTGCSSQRSVVAHYGQLAWVAPSVGVVTWDAAVQSKHTARLPLRDSEMQISKRILHDDWSLAAGGAFGRFITMSLPAEDLFNRHTWVLNDAGFETVSGEGSGPSWCGYWTGTRPVEWVYGVVAGAEQIYHVSTDEDGENRLWKCFLKERLDNNCPITWMVSTRGYFGATSIDRNKIPHTDALLCYADVGLTAMEEELDIAIFYAGGMRGANKRILTRLLLAQRGSLNMADELTMDDTLFEFKPQSRTLRTEDVRHDTEATGSCPIERKANEDIDESFQLTIVGHGPVTIRYIRAWATPMTENQSGGADACTDETDIGALRFDGFGKTGEDLEEVTQRLALAPIPFFESNRTVTLTQDGISKVGVGYGESVVSQEAADRLAERIATHQAEVFLQNALAPTFSEGRTD
jgi:hypothetical protein